MRAVLLVTALLVLLGAPLDALPRVAQHGPFDIEVVRENGDLLCTIAARNAPVQAIVAELAERAGLEIDGARHVPNEAEATVRLERRPLDQVLQYVVGGLGVRASTTSHRILLRPELPPFPTETDLLDAADLAYRRALKYDPNSAFADRAEFALGQIALRRGNPDAAVGHWDILIDQYKESPLVPEALFRGAEVRVSQGRWADAALELSELIELEIPHEFAMDAHRLLALCTTRVGNHQRALYHIDALDKQFPPETGAELARRNFIRARAHTGLGNAVAALRLLDARESRLFAGDHPGERIELVAAAMQVAGRPQDAAVAWLEYAGRATGTEQARAYGLAAELALEAQIGRASCRERV